MVRKFQLRKILWSILVCFGVAYPAFSLAEGWRFKVGIYGFSDHFDDNPDGGGYVEQNYGASIALPLPFTFFSLIENEVEVGAFRNSFDDLAIWVGGGSYFSINEYVTIGVNAYHWYTARNTYKDRIVAFYPVFKINLSDNFGFKTRWSKNSIVGSFEITF